MSEKKAFMCFPNQVILFMSTPSRKNFADVHSIFVNVILEVWPDNGSKRLSASYVINIPLAFPLWPCITFLHAFFLLWIDQLSAVVA